MSASPQATAAEMWVDLILGNVDPVDAWTAIFARLRELSLSNPGAAALHRETIVPDRLLAESAWDLWQQFPRCAPTVIGELKQFWVSAAGYGTAVLVLDGLSLRELPLIVTAGQQRGLGPTRVEVRAAEVPTETDRFAQAMGLTSRSELYNNQAPAGFSFKGPDVYTDVLKGGSSIASVGFLPSRASSSGIRGQMMISSTVTRTTRRDRHWSPYRQRRFCTRTTSGVLWISCVRVGGLWLPGTTATPTQTPSPMKRRTKRRSSCCGPSSGRPGAPRKTRPNLGRDSTCPRWSAGTTVGWSSWASASGQFNTVFRICVTGVCRSWKRRSHSSNIHPNRVGVSAPWRETKDKHGQEAS